MKKWLLLLLLTIGLVGLLVLLRRPQPSSPVILSETSTQASRVVSSTNYPPVRLAPNAPAPVVGNLPNAAENPPVVAKPVTPNALTAPLSPAPAPAPSAAPEAPSDLEPATLLENMRTTLRQYGLTFGGNPVGTNPEITKALNGDNPKQIKFLGPDGNRINQKGELIDAWGTPYFFHQLSAMEMEIRSAGPDKIMWTADDLVIK